MHFDTARYGCRQERFVGKRHNSETNVYGIVSDVAVAVCVGALYLYAHIHLVRLGNIRTALLHSGKRCVILRIFG